MRIAIIANLSGNGVLSDIQRLAELLSGRAELFAEENSFLSDHITFLPEKRLFSECDLVLSLGGDGTLLAAAGKASLSEKPVLGINTGRLGFLTGVEREYFFSEGYKKITDSLETENRMMLHACINVKEFHVLNDIVVTRTSFARVGNISVYVDGEILAAYPADGVIVATPTGSTAYSLSAGGPVIDPGLEAIIITPVCPHMLNARPVVVPPDKTITVVKTEGYTNECAMTADGKNGCVLNNGDSVTIKKSERYTRLVKINDRTFYRLLKEKLQY